MYTSIFLFFCLFGASLGKLDDLDISDETWGLNEAEWQWIGEENPFDNRISKRGPPQCTGQIQFQSIIIDTFGQSVDIENDFDPQFVIGNPTTILGSVEEFQMTAQVGTVRSTVLTPDPGYYVDLASPPGNGNSFALWWDGNPDGQLTTNGIPFDLTTNHQVGVQMTYIQLLDRTPAMNVTSTFYDADGNSASVTLPLFGVDSDTPTTAFFPWYAVEQLGVDPTQLVAAHLEATNLAANLEFTMLDVRTREASCTYRPGALNIFLDRFQRIPSGERFAPVHPGRTGIVQLETQEYTFDDPVYDLPDWLLGIRASEETGKGIFHFVGRVPQIDYEPSTFFLKIVWAARRTSGTGDLPGNVRIKVLVKDFETGIFRFVGFLEASGTPGWQENFLDLNDVRTQLPSDDATLHPELGYYLFRFRTTYIPDVEFLFDQITTVVAADYTGLSDTSSGK